MAADMKETINVTVVQNWTLYWDVTTARDDIRFPETASNVMFVVVSVFSVLGTVANLLTLTALTRNPRLCRRATTTFVLNLALADCVFSCATGPLDAAVFYHRYWPYSTSLCTAVALLRHLTVGASLFSIQLITINRYMSVFHPSWYCTSGGSCLLMVATSWIAPAVLLLPPTIRTSGSFGYDSREASCTISRGSDSLYKAFLYLSSACIPIVTFLRCYPSLFLALRRSQRRLTLHSVSAMKLESIATQDKTFVNVNRAPSLVQLSPRKMSTAPRPDREKQLLLVIVAIFGAFLVCYVPILVVTGLDVAVEYPWLRLLTYLTFYASAWANPLIYVVMSREYRQAYVALITGTGHVRDSDSS